jgi:hypothetical protein
VGAAGIFRAVLGGKGARPTAPQEEKFILFPDKKVLDSRYTNLS